MILVNRTEEVGGALVTILFSTQIGGCASALRADVAPVSITRSERVEVDGARLFLQVRGADRCAPVLLWLHGGPGGAERPLFRYFNGQLEEHFVVAYWDQRGAGRSFDPRADPAHLTVAQHLADLNSVVDHLTRVFDRDCIVLIGHSWGSALGLLYASEHPGKLCGFIGVNQVVSTLEAQRAQYAFVMQEASARHDRDVLTQLQEIGEPPFETVGQGLSMERLVERYGGLFHRRPNRLWIAAKLIFRGLVPPWEIPRLIRANVVSLEAMHEELLALDLRRRVPQVDVPAFFFLGRHDRQTDPTLAATYFAGLEAPIKRLLWFENSAHNIPFEEPDRFNASLVRVLESTAFKWPHAPERTRPRQRAAVAQTFRPLCGSQREFCTRCGEPHSGGAHSAPARERRGAKGPRQRPSRGLGRSPTLVRFQVCPRAGKAGLQACATRGRWQQ